MIIFTSFLITSMLIATILLTYLYKESLRAKRKAARVHARAKR